MQIGLPQEWTHDLDATIGRRALLLSMWSAQRGGNRPAIKTLYTHDMKSMKSQLVSSKLLQPPGDIRVVNVADTWRCGVWTNIFPLCLTSLRQHYIDVYIFSPVPRPTSCWVYLPGAVGLLQDLSPARVQSCPPWQVTSSWTLSLQQKKASIFTLPRITCSSVAFWEHGLTSIDYHDMYHMSHDSS